MNPNIETIHIAFLPASNGVGIELFEFGMKQGEKDGDAGIDPGTVLDEELSGFFHLAIKSEQDPEEVQQDIVAAGGQKLGTTLVLGPDDTATNSRDPWGNIIEAISCDFNGLLKNLFGS